MVSEGEDKMRKAMYATLFLGATGCFEPIPETESSEDLHGFELQVGEERDFEALGHQYTARLDEVIERDGGPAAVFSLNGDPYIIQDKQSVRLEEGEIKLRQFDWTDETIFHVIYIQGTDTPSQDDDMVFTLVSDMKYK